MNPVRPRRAADSDRRKLDVASAMAWESLVDAHVEQAKQFVIQLAPFEPIEESLPRYFREMDLQATMAAAVRTRVFTGIEEQPPVATGNLFEYADGVPRAISDADDDDESWTLFRQPQRMVRDVIRRQRRAEQMERVIQLALARAEENIIRTHIENAIGFVALLDDLSFDRAIQTYLSAVGVTGGRAQAVFQRTMARLADVHLGPGSS